MKSRKLALRIASRVCLVLVAIGFCMPIACEMNGFQIATSEMVESGGLKASLFALFFFACTGIGIGIFLLSGKMLKILWDWTTLAGTIVPAIIAFILIADGDVKFQSGAYVIGVGLALSLACLIAASLQRESPPNQT